VTEVVAGWPNGSTETAQPLLVTLAAKTRAP
jgi:hypothetical protein